MDGWKPPLHERVKPLGSVRGRMRQAFFNFVDRMWQTDDARRIAGGALSGLLNWHPTETLSGLENVTVPYPELGQVNCDVGPAKRSDIVIISARFRSGSTLLWSIFRKLHGVTAYYEPFNERQWFDPKLRGSRVDRTHRNVSEYWREYDGLDELGHYYREEWTYRNLLMDGSFWNPEMKRYIEILVEKSGGRPVFQFNRIDFRLAWLRQNFPHAKIVHLYRNPRDQWCSSLMDLKSFPPDAGMREFRAHDKFYLIMWAADLKYQFPFLDEKTISHPYELFYYIWKLSYLFGVKYAHHSLQFEALVEKPEATLSSLFRVLDVHNSELAKLKRLVTKVDIGKWQHYADDAWFKRHESGCEEVLTNFLNARVTYDPDHPRNSR
jgi:hypothetical protein